jgi:hypothetical protein
MGCNDCHTPWKMGPQGPEPDMDRFLSGHPEQIGPLPMAKAAEPFLWSGFATNTAFSGPWGVSYAFNLTPEQNTGLGIWTEEMFMQTIRTGRHMGVSRPINPPMPWPAYRNATDDDIREVVGQEILVGTAPLIPLIGIGLLLTTAGIYGVLAFAITRRARELAVRLAIGATNRHVISLVATQALRLVGIGAVIGVGLTFALSRVVRAGGGAGTLYDPPFVAFIVPAVILAATGIVASWIPSRRALKINPAIVLRTT